MTWNRHAASSPAATAAVLSPAIQYSIHSSRDDHASGLPWREGSSDFLGTDEEADLWREMVEREGFVTASCLSLPAACDEATHNTRPVLPLTRARSLAPPPLPPRRCC